MGKPLQHLYDLPSFSHKPVSFPTFIFLICVMLLPKANVQADGITKPMATTYYVSPNGNDNNAGTANAPFQTVRHGLEQVQPGDSLKLMAGTYREGEIYIDNGGSSTSPVVIQGAGPGQTFIKGSEVVDGWTQHNGSIWRVNWGTNSQQLFVDGKHLQQIGATSGWHGNNLEAVGNGLGDMSAGSFFYDNGVLYAWLADGGNPNNHLMEASVKNWLLDGENRSSYITMCDLTLAHSNGTHDGSRGYLLKTGTRGWILDNLNMAYGDFMCINLTGIEHIMRNCTIQYGGDVGLDMNNSDNAHNWTWYEGAPFMGTLIEGCFFTKNNYRNFYWEWHGGAMKLIPAIKGLTLRKNRIEDNNGPGIWFDHAVGENIITDNLIIGNEYGIFYEIQPNLSSTDFGAIICNNRVIGSKLTGIYVSASSNVVVQHNTVYDCWLGIAVHGMPRGDFELYSNVITKNVIFGTDIGDLILFEGADAGNNRIDSNFYVTGIQAPDGSSKNDPRVGIVNGGGYNINYTSLNSLRSSTDYGNGALEGDPQWLDAANYDFRKAAGSPAAHLGYQDACCCDDVLLNGGIFGSDTTGTDTSGNGGGSGSGGGGGAGGGGGTGGGTASLPGIRLNVGGGLYTTDDGREFIADDYYQGSTNVFVGQDPVGGTIEDDLYNVGRYGTNFSYNIPVDNDTFDIILHFSEPGFATPGLRVFDVNIEGGHLELDDFDVAALVANYYARIEVFEDVIVTDNELNISFISSLSDAIISAIEVVPVGNGGGGNTTFPIELLGFTAEPIPAQQIVELNWSTGFERDNQFFTIERSLDGQLFSSLDQVASQGNSTQVQSYKSVDRRPIEGKSYYRLKQTDFNGMFTYSNQVEVDFAPDGSISLHAFPVPGQTGHPLHIEMTAPLDLKWKFLCEECGWADRLANFSFRSFHRLKSADYRS